MTNEKIPKKRVRNREEKVGIIFNIFFDLVKKKGYANVSTNQIAEIAGISIGTIYRYFPKGKVDIIRKYYDSEKQNIFDIEELFTQNNSEIIGFVKKITTKYVQVHRDNQIIHEAYELAMHEDKEVHDAYKEEVIAFIHTIASKIVKAQSIDSKHSLGEIEKTLLLIYNVYDALTHQHLFVMPLFPTDTEFIEFLTKMFLSFTTQMNVTNRNIKKTE